MTARNFWGLGGEPRRIEDYGLIGDSETAALVSRTGSIDWLCWPRFDSEAGLCALLGTEENGFWRIAPTGEVERQSWRYRDDTLIIDNELETADGRVRLTELMPMRGASSDLIRIVEGLEGEVQVRSVLDLRFEYGRLRPLVRRIESHRVSALAGPHAVVLRSDHDLEVEDHAICCEFSIAKGERACFVLTYFPSHHDAPDAVDPEEAIKETECFWRDWAGRCTYEGDHRDAVVRSMVTLKALTYRPTGGTVAAPTSSLPEAPGGERNWDYRYCWLRDAAFMLLSFVHAGYLSEAEAWRDWLLRAVAGGSVRPLFGLDGDQGILEYEAPWLCGFNGARPVRFGNGAHDQVQLDVFGEVIDAFALARKHGVRDHDESWLLQKRLLTSLEDSWNEPDAGFWESRDDPQHYVHSKVLAWAAFDRGARHFGEQADEEAIARWSGLRDRIRQEILDKGFDEERGSFVRAYGSKALDASLLILPLIGFVHPKDPKAVGTVEAIQRELMPDGLVLRYDTDEVDDGLPGREGAFLACSFWLVDNLHLQGRTEEARALFGKLLGLRNDLGLLSEEYLMREQRMLGNFPQALSHVGLVNSALNLSEANGPAEDRLSMHREEQS